MSSQALEVIGGITVFGGLLAIRFDCVEPFLDLCADLIEAICNRD